MIVFTLARLLVYVATNCDALQQTGNKSHRPILGYVDMDN